MKRMIVAFLGLLNSARAQDVTPLAVFPNPPLVSAYASEQGSVFQGHSELVDIKLSRQWTGIYTLAGWVRLNPSTENPGNAEKPRASDFAALLDSQKNEPMVRFSINQGKLILSQRDGDSWKSLGSSTVISTGVWTHVVGECDTTGTLHLFINGREDASKRVRQIPKVPVDRLRVGSPGWQQLHGEVAAMQFYPGPLSVPAIQSLAQAASGAATASIIKRGLPLATIVRHPDQQEHADFNERWLQVTPTSRLPLAGGLHGNVIVWPGKPGALPGIIAQSDDFGAATTYFPNENAPGNSTAAGSPFQLGKGIPISKITVNGSDIKGPLMSVKIPGKGMVLATVTANPATGLQELFWLPPSNEKPLSFGAAESIPCGPQNQPFGTAYPGSVLVFLGDVDGDGVPDLLLMTTRGNGSYFPDAPKNFWMGEELPNSGPGKGYTVNGKWLGEESIATYFWAKGTMTSDGKLHFGPRLPIIQGENDFALQWKGFSLAMAAVLPIGGTPHLVLAGDLDRVLAMPVQFRNGTMYCGPAANLLAGDGRLVHIYIPQSLSVFDMDGDGQPDLVISGNPSSSVILSGTRVGGFAERQAFTIGGPLAMQTLIVPSRVDWDGDGTEDIIAGDASGWLMFWPGTRDPRVYGAPDYFKVDGNPMHIQAGYSGSIQGPVEARWGYLNPVACDWAGNGKPDIISVDINGDLLLWRRATGHLELRPPERFTFQGKPLSVAWRQRPAFVPGKDRMAGDDRPCLLIQDVDGDLALAVPKAKDSTEIVRVEKLKYQDGADIRTCGPAGDWGRSKFCWVDWDHDGVCDVIYGTNRASNKFIIAEDIGRRTMPLFLKNVGTNAKPVFARPVPIKLGNKFLNFGAHVVGLWPVDWDHDGKPGLMIGAEDGRIYAFKRDELTP